jgi:hypothetical protein
MPINEYFFLLIKDKIQLNINKNNDLNNDYIPYIEAYFDKNLNFNNDELEKKDQNGKTIFTLEKDKKYTLTISNNDSSIEIPNLLIKYSFSNNKDFSYFELNDNNINYDINRQILSFNQITKKGNNELLSSSEFSVNYNIYIYQKQISKYLVNDEIPLKTIKIDNSQNTEVNISSYLNDEIGTFYINILAEARIKGENINEYILYNEKEIENGMKVIKITNTDFGEENIYNIPKAFFKASIELEDNDNENLDSLY